LEDILADAKERGEPPFVIVLDSIEDPHNLGAILRSAECCGAHGVVIGKHRSVSLNASVARASAGAVEYIKVARVVNISAALRELKKQGLWIAGASMEGQPMTQANLKGPLALVVGSEGAGLSRIVKEQCDLLAAIPITGRIASLNASVAAAVIMYEKLRQDAE
jgi:23S rRNA (guanosine2251-2'-O)-methyltransferase